MMAKFFRSKLVQKWLFLGLVWAIGLCFVGWATPVGPRDGWLIPYGQQVLGFLSDGKTLLCQDYPESRNEKVSSPAKLLSLWDYETGQRIKELPILINQKIEHTIEFNPFSGKDWIFYTEPLTPLPDRKPGEKWSPPERRRFALRVYDASSGELISGFEYTARVKWTTSSYDGKKLLLQNMDENGSQVLRIYDIQSGRLLSEIKTEGMHPVACFSWDSSKLALRMIAQGKPYYDPSQPNTRIYECETGHLIAELVSTAADLKKHLPFALFSFNDALILDKGAVFDPTTGKKNYDVPEVYATFSPDSQFLISTTKDGDRVWLVFSDAQTGIEIPQKRMQLPHSECKVWSAWVFLRNKNFLIVNLVGQAQRKLSWIEQWLIKLPRMDWLGWERPTFIVIDYATGKIIAEEHQGPPSTIAPDARSFLIGGPHQGGIVRWDIPSTRPWISLLLSWTVWSLIFWLTQNRIFMILRMTTHHPSPLPQGSSSTHARS